MGKESGYWAGGWAGSIQSGSLTGILISLKETSHTAQSAAEEISTQESETSEGWEISGANKKQLEEYFAAN